jgi:hypothetical protein
VQGERREDRIGVWVRRPDKGEGFKDKIAAIGIRVQHWVMLHGFALNNEPDLSHFCSIVPRWVSDRRYGVTSLADLGLTLSMPEIDMVLRKQRSSRSPMDVRLDLTTHRPSRVFVPRCSARVYSHSLTHSLTHESPWPRWCRGSDAQ